MKHAQSIEHMDQISPPIQPKLKVNAKDYVEMVLEWNPIPMKRHALFYQFDTTPDLDKINLIPDGCINILFKCDHKNPEVWLSGLMLREKSLRLEANTTYFGFKPYSPAAIRSNQLKFDDLLDDKIELKYYFPEVESLTEQILLATNLEERLDIFLNYAQKYLIDYDFNYNPGEHLAATMCKSKGQRKIGDLAQMIGYTERHCRKKFKDLFGITLTQYNRIMRFQSAIKKFYRNEHLSMTNIAHDSGYFDQAHFIRDFKKFTTDSPTEFKKSLLV